jgi:hypothetical protein
MQGVVGRGARLTSLLVHIYRSCDPATVEKWRNNALATEAGHRRLLRPKSAPAATPRPSSMADSALRRQAPEVGAVCPNRARTASSARKLAIRIRML